MDYKQIQTFLQLVRDRNMTKAADRLFITQSTVSYRMRTLEDELGFSLIDRKKGVQMVSLTDAGKQFVPIAEEWLSLYERTNAFCLRKTAVTIRIAAPDSIHHLFRGKYKRLRENVENIRLSLTTVNSEQVAFMLKSGAADLGFSFLEIQEKGIACDIEDSFPLMVFIVDGGTSCGERKAVASLSALDPAKMVQIKGMGFDNPKVREIIRQELGHDIEGIAQYDTQASIINNAEQGDWGLIPLTAVELFGSDSGISIFPLENRNYQVPLYRAELDTIPGKLERLINEFF